MSNNTYVVARVFANGSLSMNQIDAKTPEQAIILSLEQGNGAMPELIPLSLEELKQYYFNGDLLVDVLEVQENDKLDMS